MASRAIKSAARSLLYTPHRTFARTHNMTDPQARTVPRERTFSDYIRALLALLRPASRPSTIVEPVAPLPPSLLPPPTPPTPRTPLSRARSRSRTRRYTSRGTPEAWVIAIAQRINAQ